MDDQLARYARQVIYPGIGESGQRALLAAHVTVIGVGATGSVLANHLARAGVGHLRMVDRDFVELNNLQRQLVYDEDDVAQVLPKAVAMARKLRRINSAITIEDVVADVNATNIAGLIADADVVLDGTDNFATRYLINDACVKSGKPWVYSGVLATYGMSMTIRPGVTPCLRCTMGELPAPGTVPTIKLILAAADPAPPGTPPELNTGMIHIDLWDHTYERFDLGGPRPDCPTCGGRRFEFLNAEAGSRLTALCGRNAVQVSVVGSPGVDLAALAERLRAAHVGTIQANAYLLRAEIDGYEFTIFPDSRAIIKGTADEAAAATLYARYVGM
jgi:molybdopterin/thiamine biosynthesis adenylyltransferase